MMMISCRFFAGPMYEFYNSVLRAKGDTIPWGDDYPMLRGERVTGRFVTTIHAVSLNPKLSL